MDDVTHKQNNAGDPTHGVIQEKWFVMIRNSQLLAFMFAFVIFVMVTDVGRAGELFGEICFDELPDIMTWCAKYNTDAGIFKKHQRFVSHATCDDHINFLLA